MKIIKKHIKYQLEQNNPLCLIVYYMVHALYMDQNILKKNKMYFCLLHICIMILYDYLVYKGYKTGYCSDVTILHMEGVSTSERMDNKKKKVIFRFKNNIKSIEAQLEERKKYIN